MPPIVHREGGLQLTFHAQRVIRWDQHRAYERGLRLVQGTRAADFCVQLTDGSPAVLEITDYRGHHLGAGGGREAIRSGVLIDETAEKVRDSLAGIIWAAQRDLGDPPTEPFAQSMLNPRDRKLLVVLWIEDDRVDSAGAVALSDAIRSRLKSFVNCKVVVTSLKLEAGTSHPLEWLSVKNAA